MCNRKKTAVMYGAGNIGRGFIGQVFHDSGFEVVFIDIDKDVVSALNERKSYTQLIVEGDSVRRREISGVRAVDGNDRDAVIREITGCDIMAVSVGAAVLPRIAPLLADGLAQREKALNILVCENLAQAPDVLRGLVSEHLLNPHKLNRVGFVGTTIGRMVPFVPPQQREDDHTLIAVEKFCTLPIDGDAIVSPFPKLSHTVLFSPFAFEDEKKPYIHNMGHAMVAYLGYLKGYTYIWQAMGNDALRFSVREAMNASADALAKKYSEDEDDLSEYVEDLLLRFGNRGLGDTVTRVGADPMRKLAPCDRFIGAINLCKEQDVDYKSILSGVAAALRFNVSDDPSAEKLQKRLKQISEITFLSDYCGLSKDDAMLCLSSQYLNPDV